jgi:pimeloyl-ACP methyl ester carboxylesterase
MAPVWDRLGELQLPVLLLAGGLDGPYVRAQRRMQAGLPSARAETIPGAGHAPHLEKPEAVAEALRRFLDDLPRRGCRDSTEDYGGGDA